MAYHISPSLGVVLRHTYTAKAASAQKKSKWLVLKYDIATLDFICKENIVLEAEGSS